MAMTKVEAAKLTQDMMLRGVIETIITESMILELLPFMDMNGTGSHHRGAVLNQPAPRPRPRMTVPPGEPHFRHPARPSASSATA